jgi:hypothetical protein
VGKRTRCRLRTAFHRLGLGLIAFFHCGEASSGAWALQGGFCLDLRLGAWKPDAVINYFAFPGFTAKLTA